MDKSSTVGTLICVFVLALVFSPDKVEDANQNYDNRNLPTGCTSPGGCAPGETPIRPTYRACETTNTCPDIADINPLN